MKQTAMQELKNKIQTAISELNGEMSEYKSGYKQCLINIQNDIDAQILKMEKEQIIDAVYYGHLKRWVDSGVINSYGEQYYNETYKSE